VTDVELDWATIDADLLVGRIVHAIAAYRAMTSGSLQEAIARVTDRVDCLRATRGEEFTWAPGDIEFYS
jgi:hypothetical protein